MRCTIERDILKTHSLYMCVVYIWVWWPSCATHQEYYVKKGCPKSYIYNIKKKKKLRMISSYCYNIYISYIWRIWVQQPDREKTAHTHIYRHFLTPLRDNVFCFFFLVYFRWKYWCIGIMFSRGFASIYLYICLCKCYTFS